MTDEPQATHEEGQRLIRAAFEAAHASGRAEWQRMTTAVLKNRILHLTGREFEEGRWGATSFRQFVDAFPELVAVDSTVFPPIVQFREAPRDETVAETGAEVGAESTMPQKRMTPQQRVRPDLWTAILDYSSGQKYVWATEIDNNDKGRAVPAADDAAGDPRPVLPQVTPETLTAWREEFAAARLEHLSPRLAEALQRWKDEELPSASLPGPIRGHWNAALKLHVIELLEGWFKDRQLSVPQDLVVTEPSRPTAPDTERLRRFIYEWVSVMTREELEALPIPAAVVLRAGS